jgi:hypothetical protein
MNAAAAAATPSQSAFPAARTAYGDETLVRHAIERLRLTYNARLSSHNDAQPLTFQACDITVAADQAVATCGAETQSSEKLEPRVVTFTLKRAGGGWEITGIQTVDRDSSAISRRGS